MLQQTPQQQFQTETLTEYMPIERKVIEYETVTRKIQVPVVEEVIDYVPVHTQHHQYSPPREQITIQPQITHYVPSPPKIVHHQPQQIPIHLHQSKIQQQVQPIQPQMAQIIHQRPIYQWQQQYQPQIPQFQQLPHLQQGMQQQFIPIQHHGQVQHQRPPLQHVQQIPQPQIPQMLQRPIQYIQPIPEVQFQQQTFAPQNFAIPQVPNPIDLPQYHTSVRPEEFSYQYNQQPRAQGPTPQFYNMSEQKAQQQFREFQQYQQQENFQPQPRPHQVQFDPEELQEDSNREYQPRRPQGVQFEDDQVSEQQYPHQPAQVINNLPQDRGLQRDVYQDQSKRTLKKDDYFKDKVFL